MARTAYHHLGGAAADIHHHKVLAREIARCTRERQPRFLPTGDDRKDNAELRQTPHELIGVPRIARCRGGHRDGLGDGGALLGKAVTHGTIIPYRFNSAVDRGRREHTGGIDAFAKVGDGVFAIHLMDGARGVDIRHEHAARDRSDVDGGIAPCSKPLHAAFGHGNPLACLFVAEHQIEQRRVPRIGRLHAIG